MKNLITTLLTTALVLVTSVVFSQGACEGETSYTYQDVTYDLIEIGDQCWFDGPIKSAFYSDGSPIQNIGPDGNEEWRTTTTGAFVTNINGDYLYNWYAVSQGVCPAGYNVPTDRDFILLETELGIKRSERSSFGYRGTGTNFKANWFEAGFDIDFAGLRVDNDGNLKEYENGMYMWTLDEVNDENAIDRAIFDYMPFIARHDNLWQTSNNKGHGMLAMCVKDDAQDALAIEGEFSPMFIMPGPTTIESQDFTGFNAGDTVYFDESFTQVPEVGSLFINPRGDSLITYNRGVLLDISDWTDLTGDYYAGPTGTHDQVCGCIGLLEGGGCGIAWQHGPSRLDCATICANAGLSYTFNLQDWQNCFGQGIAPTSIEDFKGYTFITPRGTEYPVTKWTNDIFFDDMPNIRSAADFTSVRAYVDPARTIPYTYENLFAPSARSNPQAHYVYWTNEVTGEEHIFEISGVDGFLVELDYIPTETWPKTIACMCQSCCVGGGSGNGPATTGIPPSVNVPMFITFFDDPGAGNLSCTYGCPGEGYSANGGAPGGCCGNYGYFDPIGPDLSDLEDYYVSYGDTTIANFDQFFTLNVLDTIYTNPEKTTVPKVGTSFINEYQEILYTDDRGVLRYPDFFGDNVVREYYGDPLRTGTMWCCDPSNGIGLCIIITSHFRRGCKFHCSQRGFDCLGNCSYLASDFFSTFISDPKNAEVKASLIRSITFNIDSYRSPGEIDFSSDLDGVYLSAEYRGNAQDFNEFAIAEENHFSYLKDFVVKINNVYYKFTDDLMLEKSTANGGLDLPVDWPPSGPFGDPFGNACGCKFTFGSHCWISTVFGPTWRSCVFICKRAGGEFGTCFNGSTPPGEDEGQVFHVAYGDSSRYYGDIGYTFNVFDTVYTDYAKTRPIPFGLSIRNAYNQVLYADAQGVLKYADMFDEDVVSGYYADPTQTQTCICCYTPPLGEPFSVTVTTTDIRRGCAAVCEANGYDAFSFNDCDFPGETDPLSMDQVSRTRYRSFTSDAEFLLFNKLVQGLKSSFVDPTFVLDQNDVRGIVGQTLSFSFKDELLRGAAQKTDPANYEFMKGIVFKISGEPYWFRINESFVVEGGVLNPPAEWGGSGEPTFLNMCVCWSDAPECAQNYEWSEKLRRSCVKICGSAGYNSFNPCND